MKLLTGADNRYLIIVKGLMFKMKKLYNQIVRKIADFSGTSNPLLIAATGINTRRKLLEGKRKSHSRKW